MCIILWSWLWFSLECEKRSNTAASASQEKHIHPCFSQLALQEKSSPILVTFVIPLARIRERGSLSTKQTIRAWQSSRALKRQLNHQSQLLTRGETNDKSKLKTERQSRCEQPLRFPGPIQWFTAKLNSTTLGIYISCVCTHQNVCVPSYRQQQENRLFWGKFLRTASTFLCWNLPQEPGWCVPGAVVMGAVL